MNSLFNGWKLGGRIALRLAIVYMIVAALIFYLQTSTSSYFAQVWNQQTISIVGLVGSGWSAFFITPLLMLVPLFIAWLTGSVAGLMTGLLAGIMTNKTLARWWGIFCFSAPILVFHNAAALRPNIVLGEHWLNSYWFWVGLPSLICILVGRWVGEQLTGSTQFLQEAQA